MVVKVEILDIFGKKVIKTTETGDNLFTRLNPIVWLWKNDIFRDLPGGDYMVKLTTDGFGLNHTYGISMFVTFNKSAINETERVMNASLFDVVCNNIGGRVRYINHPDEVNDDEILLQCVSIRDLQSLYSVIGTDKKLAWVSDYPISLPDLISKLLITGYCDIMTNLDNRDCDN
jgi:hypothetical protein